MSCTHICCSLKGHHLDWTLVWIVNLRNMSYPIEIKYCSSRPVCCWKTKIELRSYVTKLSVSNSKAVVRALSPSSILLPGSLKHVCLPPCGMIIHNDKYCSAALKLYQPKKKNEELVIKKNMEKTSLTDMNKLSNLGCSAFFSPSRSVHWRMCRTGNSPIHSGSMTGKYILVNKKGLKWLFKIEHDY